ncbi:MAG: rhodanese-like domain-containing protein [Beijerinckiaceae bacterium]
MFSIFKRGVMANHDISHDELAAASADSTTCIIDVREPGEFKQGHIPGAINLPLSRFDKAQIPRDRPVALICLSGARSGAALRELQQSGFDNVRHYRPGMAGWKRAGGRCA